MEKKFKCQSCSNVFTADTNTFITCPKCHSDNISVVKSSLNVKVIIGIVAALVVVGGVVAFLLLSGGKGKPATYAAQQTETQDIDDPVNPPIDPAEEEPIEGLAGKIEFGNVGLPQYDENNKTYTVQIQAEIQGDNSGDFKIVYVAKNLETNAVIAESKTGIFTSLQPIPKSPSNPESAYRFVARAMKGEVCTDSIDTNISGFVVHAVEVKKVSLAEIQNLIDSKASVSVIANIPGLSKKPVLRCQGDSDGESLPTTLNELIRLIKMPNNWVGAKIINVDYDDNNFVTAIVYTPVINKD